MSDIEVSKLIQLRKIKAVKADKFLESYSNLPDIKEIKKFIITEEEYTNEKLKD